MKNYMFTAICIATCFFGYAQSKNFIDQPYLETNAKVDSLVKPDRIYLSILIQEKEDRDKTSVEKQEREMASVLEGLGINLKKQLKIEDLASNYKKYFLRKKSVLKSKAYELIVYVFADPSCARRYSTMRARNCHSAVAAAASKSRSRASTRWNRMALATIESRCAPSAELTRPICTCWSTR